MTVIPNKNLELVSAKEQVKSKKDQMLENLKFEMLKNMKLDEKLIKRNSLTEEIVKARENTLFPKKVKIGEKEIEIKEQGKYKELIAQYKKLNTEKPAGYEEMLKVLDKELAEQIILDQNKMIEFSSKENFEGKTAEQEARSSFERLEKNKKYDKKIELIKKIDGEETHFVIKRTKKQLEEIERAERAYEQLHGAEAAEPVKQQPAKQVAQGPEQGVPTMKNITEMDENLKNRLRELGKHLKSIKKGQTVELTPPTGGLIRLQKKDDKGWICMLNTVEEFRQYVDKNHSVEDENGNKSYISYVSNDNLRKFLNIPKDEEITPEPIIEPTPEPEEEGELGPVELTATISETTQITRAIAERAAGEKLRKIYKNTSRYKPRSRPTKLTLFLGRGFMKDHYTRKYMKMKGGMQRDENLVKAADRHEMEEANKFNENIKNVGNIDEANYPRTYAALDDLAKKLTGDANSMPPRQKGIEDKDFQDQFKAIIRRNLDTTKPATATAPDRKPLAQIIKDNDMQQMSSNIVLKLNAFRDHQDMARSIADRITRNPTESDTNFNAFSRDKIIKYFNTYKKNPEFLKSLKIKLDDKNAMQELRRLQAHQGALTQIAAQTMRLKVQILAKGEEAYDVKQELKGFRGAMTKIGNRLDKPVSDKSRFGKWLERHPFVKGAFGTLRGITKLGAMITPAILLAPLGPLAVASGAGGMAFAKTLFKKYSHYNKEHIGYQRNQAVNLLNNTAERNRLMDEMSKMSGFKRTMLYYFGLGKKARDVRQFRDYVMTTHDQLADSNTLAGKMEALLKKPQLTAAEQQTLERYISEGLARLDFHKETGQNFLGSKDKDIAEKEYQSIYRLVLTGSMRIDKELDDIRQNNYYDNEMDLIKNGTGTDVDQIGYQKARKRFKHRQTEKALLGAVKAGGVAFGLSYLATSLASTKGNVEIKTNETTVGDNFALGKHELAGDNNVYTQSKDFFSAPDAANKNIVFQYGGGTDATQVMPGYLTKTEYLDKVTEVQAEIANMSNLSTQTKSNLINELQRKPWENVRNEAGFTNDYLHGMRCIEGLEQTAKALNESGANASSITLTPAHNHLTYDIIGSTYDNAGERVVQGGIAYAEKIVTPENIIPIPIPGFMNTFKETDEKESTTSVDRYGRKTRTPAPKVEKKNKKNVPPRRRTENVDEMQFTNANN